MGVEITNASATRRTKPRDSSPVIDGIVAPSTFLTPISFRRCSVTSDTIAKSPRQHSNIATVADAKKIDDSRPSFAYHRAVFSVRKDAAAALSGSSRLKAVCTRSIAARGLSVLTFTKTYPSPSRRFIAKVIGDNGSFMEKKWKSGTTPTIVHLGLLLSL